jgi:hypothetical protein
MTANLCRCNMCYNILIDKNPQIGAKEFPLSGRELEMQFFGGGVKDKNGESGNYWGCPICLTDEYLTDIE